jgi:hypothetical protein
MTSVVVDISYLVGGLIWTVGGLIPGADLLGAGALFLLTSIGGLGIGIPVGDAPTIGSSVGAEVFGLPLPLPMPMPDVPATLARRRVRR